MDEKKIENRRQRHNNTSFLPVSVCQGIRDSNDLIIFYTKETESKEERATYCYSLFELAILLEKKPIDYSLALYDVVVEYKGVFLLKLPEWNIFVDAGKLINILNNGVNTIELKKKEFWFEPYERQRNNVDNNINSESTFEPIKIKNNFFRIEGDYTFKKITSIDENNRTVITAVKYKATDPLNAVLCNYDQGLPAITYLNDNGTPDRDIFLPDRREVSYDYYNSGNLRAVEILNENKSLIPNMDLSYIINDDRYDRYKNLILKHKPCIITFFENGAIESIGMVFKPNVWPNKRMFLNERGSLVSSKYDNWNVSREQEQPFKTKYFREFQNFYIDTLDEKYGVSEEIFILDNPETSQKIQYYPNGRKKQEEIILDRYYDMAEDNALNKFLVHNPCVIKYDEDEKIVEKEWNEYLRGAETPLAEKYSSDGKLIYKKTKNSSVGNAFTLIVEYDENQKKTREISLHNSRYNPRTIEINYLNNGGSIKDIYTNITSTTAILESKEFYNENGNLHSFDDLPARIVYKDVNDHQFDNTTRYEWFIDGKHGRENKNLPCMELKRNDDGMYFEVAYCLGNGLFRLITYDEEKGSMMKDGIARNTADEYIYTAEEYKLDPFLDPYEQRNLDMMADQYSIFSTAIIAEHPPSQHDLEIDEWFNKIEEANEPINDSGQETDNENN